MKQDQTSHLTLLSFEQLSDIGIAYSREHLRRMERAEQFPERIRLSPGRVAWRLSDIENWISTRPTGVR